MDAGTWRRWSERVRRTRHEGEERRRFSRRGCRRGGRPQLPKPFRARARAAALARDATRFGLVAHAAKRPHLCRYFASVDSAGRARRAEDLTSWGRTVRFVARARDRLTEAARALGFGKAPGKRASRRREFCAALSVRSCLVLRSRATRLGRWGGFRPAPAACGDSFRGAEAGSDATRARSPQAARFVLLARLNPPSCLFTCTRSLTASVPSLTSFPPFSPVFPLTFSPCFRLPFAQGDREPHQGQGVAKAAMVLSDVRQAMSR